jgi:hypothetical protein
MARLWEGLKAFAGILVAACLTCAAFFWGGVQWGRKKEREEAQAMAASYKVRRYSTKLQGGPDVTRKILEMEQRFPRVPSDPIVDSRNLVKRLDGLTAIWHEHLRGGAGGQQGGAD